MQWRANSSQYLGQAYYSICKDNWGWSWMERWIAARPWEVRVNAKPTKKIKGKQVSNADKFANQLELKVSVSATPNGNKTTKAKKSPPHSINLAVEWHEFFIGYILYLLWFWSVELVWTWYEVCKIRENTHTCMYVWEWMCNFLLPLKTRLSFMDCCACREADEGKCWISMILIF